MDIAKHRPAEKALRDEPADGNPGGCRSNGNKVTGRARILLADDHRGMLDIVARLLTEEFEIVAAVENGERAVEAAAALDPNVVILDISMPVMNGIEAAMRLKASGSRAKVIFLTVQAQAEFVSKAFSTGAFGYVLKPRLATDLIPAVREVLEDRTFPPQSPGIDEDVAEVQSQQPPSARPVEAHPEKGMRETFHNSLIQPA
jgi:DNA-binding NarL/FixJ family response regulator